MFTARIYITLKSGVLDPQGEAVKKGLAALGYECVKEVRVGKYLELRLDAPDTASAQAQVEEMCRRLLANPVIEDFRVEV
ncbi:MAG: phosphoribosylformylglycinamidine synthase subunit PurS [Clostridia bacterium]|nr:phosphoribosylformylglycinamidine synthase subunit PurS [Clostridia bacterium]